MLNTNQLMVNKRTGHIAPVKETIVEILTSEGYGFVDACEHAEKYLDEIRDRGPGTYTYYSKTQEITIRVGKRGKK